MDLFSVSFGTSVSEVKIGISKMQFVCPYCNWVFQLLLLNHLCRLKKKWMQLQLIIWMTYGRTSTFVVMRPVHFVLADRSDTDSLSHLCKAFLHYIVFNRVRGWTASLHHSASPLEYWCQWFLESAFSLSIFVVSSKALTDEQYPGVCIWAEVEFTTVCSPS